MHERDCPKRYAPALVPGRCSCPAVATERARIEQLLRAHGMGDAADLVAARGRAADLADVD